MLVDEARLKQIETNYPAELPREMGALVTVGLIADLCETVRDAWEQRDLAREQLRVLVGQNDALQEALRRLKEPKS